MNFLNAGTPEDQSSHGLMTSISQYLQTSPLMSITCHADSDVFNLLLCQRLVPSKALKSHKCDCM